MAGTKQKTRGDPAKAGKVTKQQPNKPKTTYAHIKDHNERAHTVYTSLKKMHQTVKSQTTLRLYKAKQAEYTICIHRKCSKRHTFNNNIVFLLEILH